MVILNSIFSQMPTGAELVAASPIIVSLIILEGLLSVDNALALASMVSHLPERQQKFALKAGLLGAYLFRGLALFFVAYIIANPWIKLLGGAYLIYLMCENLGVAEEGEEEQMEAKAAVHTGLIATIVQVEMADLAFSVDNIVAAVAMSPKMWVVVLGVFIGIAAMRFVAGIFVDLIKKFPVLEKIAYVLVGYVGLQLFAEYFFEIEVNEIEKFSIIASILAFGMAYEKVTVLQTMFGGVFTFIGQVMGNVTELVDSLVAPLLYPFKKLTAVVVGCFKKK